MLDLRRGINLRVALLRLAANGLRRDVAAAAGAPAEPYLRQALEELERVLESLERARTWAEPVACEAVGNN